VEALHLVAARGPQAVTELQAAIRASPVLHVDETGWRQDGVNGYAWTFSTPTERVFVRGGRDRPVLEQQLGQDYAGVLVSDFYAVYTSYDGRHQYCWAHLLRDVDEVIGQHPADATVRGWADAVHALYARATAFADPDPAVRRQQRLAYEAALGALCAPFLGVAEAPQRVLCERITTHLRDLFVFVEDPAVPATNNAAERSLRNFVDGPQDQRRHPLPGGNGHQDDLGHAVRHLAPARARPPGRVPRPPHRSSSLNSYAGSRRKSCCGFVNC
jgi:transposase